MCSSETTLLVTGNFEIRVDKILRPFILLLIPKREWSGTSLQVSYDRLNQPTTQHYLDYASLYSDNL